MNFDKSKVYTAANADELAVGDKVIVADDMLTLKAKVSEGFNWYVVAITSILGEEWYGRFDIDKHNFPLAYLVERKENCTNCGEGKWDAEHKKILCDPAHCGNGNVVFRNHEIEVCEYWKPKTKCTDCAKSKNGGRGTCVLEEGDYEQKCTKVHLCSSCRYSYPNCPADIDDCKFGDGAGNDNVIECNKYIWKNNCKNCAADCCYKGVDRVSCKAFKTEPHYRPFRDTDELVKVWEQKWSEKTNGQRWHDCKLNMPLIWIKKKHDGTDRGKLIISFSNNGCSVIDVDEIEVLLLEDLFETCVFLDGSPCGVEE